MCIDINDHDKKDQVDNHADKIVFCCADNHDIENIAENHTE